MLGGIIKSLIFGGAGIIDSVKDLTRTIFGDAVRRDSNSHDENIAVHEEHSKSYSYDAKNRNWWDSFIDGVSRLPRPMLTFGVVWMFGLAYVDPEHFTVMMTAIETVPQPLWQAFSIILVFWFGGRLIGRDLANAASTFASRQRARKSVAASRQRIEQEAVHVNQSDKKWDDDLRF
jgi:hypothetical protein